MLRRHPGGRRTGRRTATLLAVVLGLGLLGAVSAGPASAKEQPRRIVTGWLPYWAPASAAAAVSDNKDLFTDVSPFWYTAQWSGSASSLLEQVASGTKTDSLAHLEAAGTQVLPSITDGMPARQMAAVMASASLRATFVAQIVALVQSNGYDGIDLDFEKFAFSDGRSTWATTRPAWVAFVSDLSAALHAKGKLLAVTTPPIYDSARSTTSGYWVYDWAGIASKVDRLRIMAYDYSVSGGPIAPLPWVESIVAYAVTQVPSGKIQLGIPAYGRNATVKVNGASKVVPSTSACPTNTPANYLDTLSFTAANAGTAIPSSTFLSATINRSKAVRTWDATNAEVQFSYTIRYKGTKADGTTATSCVVYRTGWYDHGASALARARLVGAYHLGGVAQWSLGGEDPTQWSPLRSYAATLKPTPTSVSVYVPSTTTYGQVVTVTARARTNGANVADARAVLYARKSGTSTWYAVSSGYTGPDGLVRLPHTVTGNMQYKVNVAADWERTMGSGGGSTQVRTAVALSLSDPTPHAWQKVTATVKLKPWIKGQVVRRQYLKNGSWITLDSARADRYGRVWFSFTPTAKGTTYHYRLYVVAAGGVRGTYEYFDVTAS